LHNAGAAAVLQQCGPGRLEGTHSLEFAFVGIGVTFTHRGGDCVGGVEVLQVPLVHEPD